jgi:hypothetical protein
VRDGASSGTPDIRRDGAAITNREEAKLGG